MKNRFQKINKENMAVSDILKEAVDNHTADRVTLGELLYTLHERGFGLLMAFLVLPNCVPIPVPPGVSTIFSVPLLFFSIQMVILRDVPWLPNWLKSRSIPRLMLANAISKASPKLKKIEKILHQRFFFGDNELGERIIGLFWLIFAITIAVPLPMTNFIPGIGILIMSLGLLSRDGIAIIIGMFIGTIGVIISILVVWLGVEFIQKILSFESF